MRMMTIIARRCRLALVLVVLLALVLPVTPTTLMVPVAYAAGGTYIINTTRDNENNGCQAFDVSAGPPPFDQGCTLREALTAANGDAGASTVNFNLSSDDPNVQNPTPGVTYWRITVTTTALPALADTLGGTTINGDSPGSNPLGPDIEIDGSAITNPLQASGIRITSANNVVLSLAVNSFGGSIGLGTGFGIRISGTSATSNTIQGNHIGNGHDSTVAKPNSGAGVQIEGGASNNTIGSSVSSLQNIISGNGLNGIVIADADNNFVYGNRIGIDKFGSKLPNGAVGQTGYGIVVSQGASGNQIGGGNSFRNIISGNTGGGIIVFEPNTNANSIQGNYIGTNTSATAAVSNTLSGIEIAGGAGSNIIGGPGQLRNIVSGNGQDGIRISDVGTRGNKLLGNIIGLAGSGLAAIPNRGDGIEVTDGASSTQIGDGSERNLVAGNIGYGILISSASLGNVITGTTIVSSSIGLNGAGSAAISNTLGGIRIGPNVQGVQVGSGLITGTNRIAGNAGPAISVQGPGVLNVTIISNTLGISGTGNAGPGITMNGVTTTLISDNEIVSNTVGISLSNVFSGTIRANRIGTAIDAASGTLLDLGNAGPGISVRPPLVAAQIISNTIGRNRGPGITISGAAATTIQGNTVSLNSGSGISLTTSTSTTIQGNTVSLNSGSGISLTTSTSATLRANTVLTNTGSGIGIVDGDASQVFSNTVRGNTNAGIDLANGTSGSRVLSNTVESNGGVGIQVNGSESVTNTIQANILRLNAGDGGIDLVGGANNGVQPPVLSYVEFLEARFRLFGNTNNSGGCGGISCTVEVYDTFVPPGGTPDGEAFTLLQRVPVGPSGLFTVTLANQPKLLLASTTTITGDSSEYATYPLSYSLRFTPSYSATALAFPTDVLTYVHVLTNSGTVSDSIRISGASSLGWSLAISPTQASLAPNQSITVTAVLTVPVGGQSNSQVGLIDTTTLTATQSLTTTSQVSVTDRTALGAAPRISLTTGQTQTVKAGDSARFSPTIRNDGNITVTVALTASTSIASWPTSITPLTVTLPPGASQVLGVQVAVPLGSIAPLTATTQITATALTVPTLVATNTNTVRLVTTPEVTINPDQIELAGVAGATTSPGRYNIFYGGNGPATVQLLLTPSADYVVSVESATAGRPLLAGNRIAFSGPGDSIEILVRVRVPSNAFLNDVRENIIAVVEDGNPNNILDTGVATVRVERGNRRPIVLPLILK